MYKQRLPVSFLQATTLQIQKKPKICERGNTKINLNKSVYKNKAKTKKQTPASLIGVVQNQKMSVRDVFDVKPITSDAIKRAFNFFSYLCNNHYAAIVCRRF